MKKAYKLLIAFVCGFLACFSWQMFADCGIEPQVKDKLPSLMEIQERVGAKPDGKYGPETRDLWDRAICNQCAGEHFKE